MAPREAVDRYPLDGVFFTMIGYTTRDYSGVEHGLCRCDACRRLDQYVRGGKLLLSGGIPGGLECIGAESLVAAHRRGQGDYLRIRPEDKARLARPALDDVDLVYLGGKLEEHNIEIEIEPVRPITSARLLSARQRLDHETRGTRARCMLPRLDHYEVLLLQYAD